MPILRLCCLSFLIVVIPIIISYTRTVFNKYSVQNRQHDASTLSTDVPKRTANAISDDNFTSQNNLD